MHNPTETVPVGVGVGDVGWLAARAVVTLKGVNGKNHGVEDLTRTHTRNAQAHRRPKQLSHTHAVPAYICGTNSVNVYALHECHIMASSLERPGCDCAHMHRF